MSARSGFDGVLNDGSTGMPLEGLKITVFDANNQQATIYTSKTGNTLKSQQFLTPSSGIIQFWVEPGYYEVEVEDTEIPARIVTRRIPFNAVAGDDGGINLSQVEIPDLSISGTKIAANSISNNRLVNKTIEAGKIKDDTITDSEINSTANISGSKLADLSVGKGKIGTDAIDQSKIEDNAIQEEHYTDGSIKRIHLEGDIIDQSKIDDQAVRSEHFYPGAVNLAAMGINSVDSDQYVDGSIDSIHIGNDQINSQHYAVDSIDAEHINHYQIDYYHMANDSIRSAAINDSEISNQHIVNDSIWYDKIHDETGYNYLGANTEVFPDGNWYSIISVDMASAGYYLVCANFSWSNSNTGSSWLKYRCYGGSGGTAGNDVFAHQIAQNKWQSASISQIVYSPTSWLYLQTNTTVGKTGLSAGSNIHVTRVG